uniref:Uncharacterized protein n=1 Tax=Timema cristinae TaxID=61476 RepID=A0A7R9CIB9_TIMCR|nr:unnamed protein product [Timema cristinae]
MEENEREMAEIVQELEKNSRKVGSAHKRIARCSAEYVNEQNKMGGSCSQDEKPERSPRVVLKGFLETPRSLRRPRTRWKDDVTKDLKELGGGESTIWLFRETVDTSGREKSTSRLLRETVAQVAERSPPVGCYERQWHRWKREVHQSAATRDSGTSGREKSTSRLLRETVTQAAERSPPVGCYERQWQKWQREVHQSVATRDSDTSSRKRKSTSQLLRETVTQVAERGSPPVGCYDRQWHKWQREVHQSAATRDSGTSSRKDRDTSGREKSTSRLLRETVAQVAERSPPVGSYERQWHKRQREVHQSAATRDSGTSGREKSTSRLLRETVTQVAERSPPVGCYERQWHKWQREVHQSAATRDSGKSGREKSTSRLFRETVTPVAERSPPGVATRDSDISGREKSTSQLLRETVTQVAERSPPVGCYERQWHKWQREVHQSAATRDRDTSGREKSTSRLLRETGTHGRVFTADYVQVDDERTAGAIPVCFL